MNVSTTERATGNAPDYLGPRHHPFAKRVPVQGDEATIRATLPIGICDLAAWIARFAFRENANLTWQRAMTPNGDQPMFRKVMIASTFALLAGAAHADTMFTVANTFEDPKMTGGTEISTIAFSADVYANQAATVGSGVEIANFVNFYDINVAADMSSLTMTVSDTAKPANNPMPAERFDRYYYTFTGAGPAAAEIDAGASTSAIAKGATATVTTTGRLVVAFGEGADFTPGNTLVVTLK